MNIKIAPIIDKARTNFWLVPSVMIMLTLCLVALAVYIDTKLNIENYPSLNLIYSVDIKAMRSLLGTISAAMITVTSIAFSITIVALTLASSQFGPRLVRNFMMDMSTQFVLGMFISTFIFCIFIFCVISFQTPYAFKPGLTWLLALSMTCFSVFVLVYFIHHVAKSIQADVIIDKVYRDLIGNIEDIKQAKCLTSNSSDKQTICNKHGKYTEHHEVKASSCGYVQLIDQKKLFVLAKDSDVIIDLHFSPGDFVMEAAVIATVHNNQKYKCSKQEHKCSKQENTVKLDNQIKQHIILGSCRTPVQDLEFAIHQLVEIALRALSPGVNDPYTAITCIDKLGSVLCDLTRKEFPSCNTFDAKEQLRLITKELSFTDIANAAFNQIRAESKNNIAVSIRILTIFKSIAVQISNDEQRSFLQTQTDIIIQQQASIDISTHERRIILSHAKQIHAITSPNFY